MKTEHMNTLQLLFLEFNRERTALIAMDADGARQRLLTSRVEAIEAAMTLAETVFSTPPSAWRMPGGEWRDGFPTAADHEAAGEISPEYAYPHPLRLPIEPAPKFAAEALVDQIDALIAEVSDAPTPIEKDIATVRARVRADYTLSAQEDQAAIDAVERIVALLGDPGKAWSDGYDAAMLEFETPAPQPKAGA